MKKMFVRCLVSFLVCLSPVIAQPAGNTEMQEALKALGALMGGGTNSAPAISQSQLKGLLPADYEGMKRSNSEAGKNAALGMNITYAMAEYTNAESNIEVKVSDVSAMGQFMKMAQFAWTQSEMERESDSGFERTTKIGGHPAQERYTYRDKSGEIQVMVDGRFMVEIKGSGVEMEQLQGMLKALDLNKLTALKPEPGAAP
jgi:uncharacterized protein YdeI (BOF family)